MIAAVEVSGSVGAEIDRFVVKVGLLPRAVYAFGVVVGHQLNAREEQAVEALAIVSVLVIL